MCHFRVNRIVSTRKKKIHKKFLIISILYKSFLKYFIENNKIYFTVDQFRAPFYGDSKLSKRKVIEDINTRVRNRL